MTSVILGIAARYLLPLQLLFSVFLLLRGHHLPGGGFSGGIVAAAAFALYAIAFGPKACRQRLPLGPRPLMAMGLACALVGGGVALIQGEPFLSHQQAAKLPFPVVGEIALGTALLFDGGVYLLVIGAVLGFLLNLQETD
ncbi:MAG: Na+/H+ antiporter subunit B [Candidatus Competibacteraceae bacterium]|nr:Na+/H+ antiporter subunit B [Candidatus Competibacteraceae bacterium]